MWYDGYLRVVTIGMSAVWGWGSVSAQTADETISYVQRKIELQPADDGSAVRLNGVALSGPLFALSYSVVHDTNLGKWSDYFREQIDLTHTEDFTTKRIAALMRTDERTIYLRCGKGYGNCVLQSVCMKVNEQGQCTETKDDHIGALLLRLNGLHNPEEEKRVKKAIVYLKSLFPLKANQEIFDDK